MHRLDPDKLGKYDIPVPAAKIENIRSNFTEIYVS